MRTALYRHFDAKGRLLYVGITGDLGHRDRQHQSSSSWQSSVARTEAQWCLSREHAIALERVAIMHEAPLHNVQCAPPRQDIPKASPANGLLERIKAHCATHGMPPSAFGSAAIGDPSLVNDLKAGREPRRKTVARIMEYMLTGKTHAETKVQQ